MAIKRDQSRFGKKKQKDLEKEKVTPTPEEVNRLLHPQRTFSRLEGQTPDKNIETTNMTPVELNKFREEQQKADIFARKKAAENVRVAKAEEKITAEELDKIQAEEQAKITQERTAQAPAGSNVVGTGITPEITIKQPEPVAAGLSAGQVIPFANQIQPRNPNLSFLPPPVKMPETLSEFDAWILNNQRLAVGAAEVGALGGAAAIMGAAIPSISIPSTLSLWKLLNWKTLAGGGIGGTVVNRWINTSNNLVQTSLGKMGEIVSDVETGKRTDYAQAYSDFQQFEDEINKNKNDISWLSNIKPIMWVTGAADSVQKMEYATTIDIPRLRNEMDIAVLTARTNKARLAAGLGAQ